MCTSLESLTGVLKAALSLEAHRIPAGSWIRIWRWIPPIRDE
jgi:hypothetical protein